MIRVVNKHKEPNHIYCGRGTALGNPFSMKDESERDKVCDQYAEYFYQKVEVEKNEPMLQQLRIIYRESLKGDVNLGCFCSPKRCHCDTIKEFIERHINENR